MKPSSGCRRRASTSSTAWKSTAADHGMSLARTRRRTTRARFLDPEDVRRGRAPEGRARRGEHLRLHAGQPGRRSARGGPGRAGPPGDREHPPQIHAYMPNAGFPQAREAVAAHLARKTGLPFTAEHILMTVGSAGACNVFLRSVLDPGDEVIVLMPCFSEYPFYIQNHAGRMVPVETDEDFLPDVERIAAAITPRTKAIILNSPNNPTGQDLSGGGSPGTGPPDFQPGPPGDGDQRRAVHADRVRRPDSPAGGVPSSSGRSSPTPGRRPSPSPASASATWPSRRGCRKLPRSSTPAPSPTASWVSSTRRPSGKEW